jgi:endoglucanase
MSTSLRGVNLAGAEYAYDPLVPPVLDTNYTWVSHQDIDYLASKGVAFGRLLFSWEILQPSLNGGFDAIYETALRDRVNYATGKGLHVMIEPHGGEFSRFARYKGNAVGSPAVPNSAFANLWSRLAQIHKGNSRVIFGLMNEPNNISTKQWYDAAQAAIVAIRAAGATNLIMVPGNGFSQPGSWNDTWYDTAPAPKMSNAVGWETLLDDPLDNLVVSVHTYFDADGGGGGTDIANPNILGQRLQPVVDWARLRGYKVHLSEFGAASTNPGAQAAVANAIAYINANDDVMIGWAWWAYGPPAWWGGYKFTLCPTNNYTVDDPKMAWLAPHFDAPTTLYIPDNPADTGSEPNLTTTIGYQSEGIWVRQTEDGGNIGESITGGQPCSVYVRVHNKGLWPSTGSHVVRLYWAKAQTGLSYPAPWNGAIASKGGPIGIRPISPTASGDSNKIVFGWTAPDPADYGGDGHFCLLAQIATTESPEFEGFSGPDLNANVLALSTAAWRNIHIVSVPKLLPKMKLGDVVLSNHTDRDMRTQLAFEILGGSARPINPPNGALFITPRGAARERLRENYEAGRRYLEDMGDGVFRVVDISRGIQLVDLRPGEELPFALEYVPDRDEKGYAVRAVQFSLDGGGRTLIGGQTFIAGEVHGFTTRRRIRRRRPFWGWLAVSASLLMFTALIAGGRKKR